MFTGSGSNPYTACNPTCISYAYAFAMGLMSPVDWAVALDESGSISPAPGAWDNDLANSTNLNHKSVGVNAVFVDGHAEWVAAGNIGSMIPNNAWAANTLGYLQNP